MSDRPIGLSRASSEVEKLDELARYYAHWLADDPIDGSAFDGRVFAAINSLRGPSGSAGEPTPTDAASRLAALRQHPEVQEFTGKLAALYCYVGAFGRGHAADLPGKDYCQWCGEAAVAQMDELLAAVAAAATAQTPMVEQVADALAFFAIDATTHGLGYLSAADALRAAEIVVRALAGGAPQGVSDAPTDDCPGCSHAKTWHGATGCDAPYCRCRAMAGHFDA